MQMAAEVFFIAIRCSLETAQRCPLDRIRSHTDINVAGVRPDVQPRFTVVNDEPEGTDF
jgi:hypothetical protein